MARIMGVLNVTPDSFSDGGLWADPDQALRHALEMVAAGADIVDVGGESTRPGSHGIGVQQELDRVVPVVEAIAAESDVLISVDTSKPEVMAATVSAGAGMINDVCALRGEGALETAVRLDVPVCLMHMQGRPRDMQQAPRYRDVVAEVAQFLLERARSCEQEGLSAGRIYIDPGFGFGKTLEHNIELFRALPRFCVGAYPVLVGVSRKSMIGALTGEPASGRLAGSLAAAVLADLAGVAVVRVHDVAETAAAIRVARALAEPARPRGDMAAAGR